MTIDNPEFVKCVIEAMEEGVKPKDIPEECACRMGIGISSQQSLS